MTKRRILIAIVIWVLYIILVVLFSPFLITFGEKTVYEELFSRLINFPVPTSVNILTPYLGPLIINGLFWGLIYFTLPIGLKYLSTMNVKEDDIIDRD